jgi:haloalkane dehalogenase
VDPQSPSAKQFYYFMRTDEAERRVIGDNMFVEGIFLKSLANKLSEADKAVYRKPWLAGGESRRPLITWPREIPVNGEPKDVHDVVVSYQQWMEVNTVPKLFVRGEPAVIMVEGENRLTAARAWSHQTEVVVPGDPDTEFPAANHYIQEQCPDEIGNALAEWIKALA